MRSIPSEFRAYLVFKRFSAIAAITVIVISAAILVGWVFDIISLKNLLPGTETTKPLGALGFLSAGMALWLLNAANGQGKTRWHFWGLACASLTFLIGGLTLFEYLAGIDIGIDRWLFPKGVLAEPGFYPGRPVFAVALCLTLLGPVLLAFRSKRIWPDLIVLAGLLAGLTALAGYIYGAVEFSRLGPYRPVPLLSALLMALISLSYLFARPGSTLMVPVTSTLSGGDFARRILPAVLLIPVGLGWLRLLGQQQGMYGTEFGVALLAVANATLLVGLVYWNAIKLNRAEAQRESAYQSLSQSEERFRLLVSTIPTGMIVVEAGRRITLVNPTAENLFGYGAGQLTGQAVEILIPERFRSQHLTHCQTFMDNAHPRLMGAGRDLFGLRQDGREFPVEIGLSPLETSEGKFTLISVMDITARKQAEDQIRALNTSLEQRVAERTRQLDYERARWQGIVKSIVDEVWTVDVQGKVSLLNLGALTGMRVDAFQERPVEEIYQEVDFLFPDGRPRLPEQAPILRSLQGEILRGEEIMLHRQTGVARYRQYSAAPIHNASGAITGAVAIVRDITEQKRAEEGLHRFELLSKHSKDIVLFMRREDGRILEANSAAVQSYGYTRDELLKLTIRDLRAPETRALTAEQMAQADASGILFESVHQRKDGSTFPVEVSSQGASIGGARTLISIVRDISERKQVEVALRMKEADLNEAQRLAHIGSWYWDAKTDITTGSDELLRIYGFDPATQTMPSFKEQRGRCYPVEDWEQVNAAVQKTLETGIGYKLDVRAIRNTAHIWVTTRSEAVLDNANQIIGLRGTVQDITEQKQIEQSLAQTARELDQRTRQLDAILSSIPDYVYIFDPAGRFVFANQKLLNLWGLTEQEAIGLTMRELNYPEAVEAALLEGIRSALETGQTVTNVTHYTSPTGAVGSYENILAPMPGPDGVLSFVAGSSRDITEREQIEEAVRRSEAMLRAVIEQMPSGVTVRDAHSGELLLSNTRSREILGELADTPDQYAKYRGFHPDGSPYQTEDWPLSRSIATGEVVHTEEVNCQRGNGDWITLSINSAPVRGAQDQIVMGVAVFDDVTERKQANEQLAAALKEKEVLLKEIHHRVKNNLQVISSLLRLQSVNTGSLRVRELFADSQRRVRAMALVHEQLYKSSNLAQIDFKDYTQSLVTYLRRSYDQSVSNVETTINIKDVITSIDQAVPLGLLVSELVTNSLKYAFPKNEPGKVWVTASHAPSAGLTLTVGDNGIGLPEEFDLEHPASMGMQLVKSFVTQLQGQLSVQKQPGTTFIVTIPERRV